MTGEAERHALVALNATPGIGPLLAARVLARHAGRLAALDEAALRAVPGVGAESARAYAALRRERFGEAECARTTALGARLLLLGDADYPELLARIPDPPPVLYLRGTLPEPQARYLAVVGSRRASAYGRAQAERLSFLLGAMGVVIASGLALGIDAAAHTGALAGGGRTAAVFGCGIDRVYPAGHQRLAARIVEQGGLLLSEFPLGMPPIAGHFPRRNRIIAGLSHGTLVVECALRSGSLITARLATDYDREVLALPGPVDAPGSRGPHMLIQDGARLVGSAEEIAEALPQLVQRPELPPPGADPQHDRLLAALTSRPQPLAEIVRRAGLPAPRAMAALALLALSGRISEHPGRQYALPTTARVQG